MQEQCFNKLYFLAGIVYIKTLALLHHFGFYTSASWCAATAVTGFLRTELIFLSCIGNTKLVICRVLGFFKFLQDIT